MKQELKVVALGDSGVGKTSIITRYTQQTFTQEYQSTVGVAYCYKDQIYKGNTYKLNIWDTAGQEKYHVLAKMYYRDSDAALLVYDIQNYQSFQGLKRWASQVIQNCPQQVALVVIGNKTDLIPPQEVPLNQADLYAQSIGASHIRVSALEDTGIADIFYEVVEVSAIKENSSRPNSIRLSREVSRQRKCCG